MFKTAKEYIPERAEDLALEKHKTFYDDLPRKVQETLWHMADRDYGQYLGGYIDYVCDTVEER